MRYFRNLEGQRFGRLVAVRQTAERRNRQIVWECRCDCGQTVMVRQGALVAGDTRSCGCVRTEHAGRIRWRLDLTGKRFGRLTAMRQVGTGKRGNLWECRCDCGGTKVVATDLLRRNLTRSCGCLLHSRGNDGKAKKRSATGL